MRLVAIVAMVCACGSSKPPLTFDPTKTATFAIDVAAVDKGKFRIKIGQHSFTPKLSPRSLPNGLVQRGTFSNGRVTIARVGTKVTGVIRAGKDGFEIVPVPGGHRIIRRSWKTARRLHSPTWAQELANRGPTPPTITTPGPVEVSVMFAYTKRVLDARDGLEGVQSLVEEVMEDINAACLEGETNVTFTGLVAEHPTESIEGARTIMDLYLALLGKTDFDDARADRKAASADLLVLLVDRPNDVDLGRAKVMGEPDTAVGVVHYDTLWELTIGHEIGHIMGVVHPEDQADPPHAHGYVGPTSRSIVTNPCGIPENCPLEVRWSRPTKFGATGVNDTALHIRNVGQAVSEFGDNIP